MTTCLALGLCIVASVLDEPIEPPIVPITVKTVTISAPPPEPFYPCGELQ